LTAAKPHLQFRVRGLIMLVILVAGCLGWMVNSARRQRSTVQAIVRSGGGVQYDWQFRDGHFVTRRSAPWRKWLEDRVGSDFLDDVTWVKVGRHGISDAELLQVGYLKRLTKLRTLGLSNCTITDAGLVHLNDLSSLKVLGLTNCKLGDAGLAQLQRRNGLLELVLSGCNVTDAGLAHLEHLSKLQHLLLRRTRVTDTGMPHLNGLTRLIYLDLAETAVTDAGLEHLKSLKSLQEIWLDGTTVTDQGARELNRSLPNLTIHR
jgi:Leucine-rich repeat (LRR) protein